MSIFDYGDDYYPKSVMNYGEGYYPDPHAKVKDRNSDVTKQTTIDESSDGTKTTTTVENKSNNPKWRGENKDSEFENIAAQDAANNYYGSMNDTAASMADDQWNEFDELEYQDSMENYYGPMDDTAALHLNRQDRQDQSFFNGELPVDEAYINPITGFQSKLIEGYPEVVLPPEGVEELRSNQTDTFWDGSDTDNFGNTMMDANGVSDLGSAEFEYAQDMAIKQANEAVGMEWEEDEYKASLSKKEKEDHDFISNYIINPQTDEDLQANKDLLDKHGRGATKASFLKRNETGDTYQDIAMEAIVDFADFVTPDAESVKDIYDFALDSEFRKDVLEAIKENPWTSASTAIALVMTRGKWKPFGDKLLKNKYSKNAVNTLFKKQKYQKTKAGKFRLNKKGEKIPLFKSQKGSKGVQPVMGYSKAKLAAWGFGGMSAYEQLGGDDANEGASSDSTTSPESTSAFDNAQDNGQSKAVTEAFARLESDPEGSVIAQAAQTDTKVANDIINNQGRITEEYGTSLAKDLFTIAMGALTGVGAGNVMGVMGEQIAIKEKYERELQAQGLKDKAALNKEMLKVQADAHEKGIEAKVKSRDDTQALMLDMVKAGGLEAGNIVKYQSEVLRALSKVDDIPTMDFGAKKTQASLMKATEDAINDKPGYFDDSEGRANIFGRFMGNMAIISADGGSLSKDGYALKNSNAANNARYTNWLFTKHNNSADITKVATRMLSDWKHLRKEPGFRFENDFTGWAVSHLVTTGKM